MFFVYPQSSYQLDMLELPQLFLKQTISGSTQSYLWMDINHLYPQPLSFGYYSWNLDQLVNQKLCLGQYNIHINPSVRLTLSNSRQMTSKQYIVVWQGTMALGAEVLTHYLTFNCKLPECMLKVRV